MLLCRTIEDTKLAGYDIPKGYQVLVNLYAIHHDPERFKEPDLFDPTRFLNEDETTVIKRNDFLTFGYGKRVCPGEPLANIELFLFITMLLQMYEIQLAPASSNQTGIMNGFSISLHNLQIIFKHRNKTIDG